MEERRPAGPADGVFSSRGLLVAGLLWVVLIEVWFQGPVLGGILPRRAAWLPFLSILALCGYAAFVALPRARAFRTLGLAVTCVLALAILVRLPALIAPAGLLSSDSAVAGLIAEELSAGQPAPIYAPGFPYEGTLKPHLTVALDPWLPGGLVRAYALASLVFYAMWIVAVMLLAWKAAGLWAAVGAGLFMAVGPRFLVAFSLNNVGQYPEVNALGALGLALLALGAPLAIPAFVIGLAVWQQLLGVYFVLVLAAAILVTPALRRPGSWLQAALGFAAGSYPLWIWNAAHGFVTFDLFRRGGKNPLDRVADLPERISRTLTVSLPKLFGLTDLGLEGVLAWLMALVLPALVVFMVIVRRREILDERGRSAFFLCGVLALVVVGLFAFSKFSNRGAARPRYLMPMYTSVAVGFGWALVGIGRRSRPRALLAGAVVLGANATGTAPWLRGRFTAHARDRAVVDTLVGLGVRTGYAGFWIAPKFSFLSEGHFVLSGELGPDVSWVHGPHAAAVRAAGPDAYVVPQGPLVDAVAERLSAIGVAFTITRVSGLAVFSGLSRRVPLEEMEGYDTAAGRLAPSPTPPPDDDAESGV